MIQVGSTPLPTIVRPVIIDGTTQPTFFGTPVIQIKGGQSFDVSDNNGLTLGSGSSGSVIRGLNIVDFEGNFDLGTQPNSAGIDIQSVHDTIAGNWIGIDASTPSAPKYAGNLVGIRIDQGGANSTIGGTNLDDRNVLSGDDGDALDINGAGSNTVENTYIGTDVNGTLITDQATGFNLYNVGNGIHIEPGSLNNAIGVLPTPGATSNDTLNLISGNFGDGTDRR